MSPHSEPAAAEAGRGRGLAALSLRAATLLLLALAAVGAAHALQRARGGHPGLDALPAATRGAILGGLALSCALALGVLAARALAWARGRWREPSAAPLRAAAVVLVGGAALYLAAFQPFNAFWVVLLLGGLGGAYALAVLVGSRIGGRLPRRLVRGLDLGLFAAALLVVLLEGSLRLAGRLTASPLLLGGNATAEQVLRRHRLAPGQPFLGFRCDQRGYPDHEATGARRPLVAAIGDSFSVGVVPHAFHYTTVAERALGGETEVYNLGVNASGPAEYLEILVSDALPLEPDLVLIALFLGNDVGEAARFRPRYPLLRAVFDRDDLLLHAFPRRWRALRAERARGHATSPDERAGEARAAGTDPAQLERAMPWLADPALERPTYTRDAFLHIEAKRALAVCDPTSLAAYTPFFAALAEIRRVIGDTPLAVLLIPDELQVEDALWTEVLAHRAVWSTVRPGTLERELPQRLVRAWLDERGVPFLDLLPVLRAVPPLEDGDRHLYALRDTHWNRRGNEVAGEALAEFLAPLLARRADAR